MLFTINHHRYGKNVNTVFLAHALHHIINLGLVEVQTQVQEIVGFAKQGTENTGIHFQIVGLGLCPSIKKKNAKRLIEREKVMCGQSERSCQIVF